MQSGQLKASVILTVSLITMAVMSSCTLEGRPSPIVASAMTGIYHERYSDCGQKIQLGDVVEFDTVKQAEKAGYRECPRCGPTASFYQAQKDLQRQGVPKEMLGPDTPEARRSFKEGWPKFGQ